MVSIHVTGGPELKQSGYDYKYMPELKPLFDICILGGYSLGMTRTGRGYTFLIYVCWEDCGTLITHRPQMVNVFSLSAFLHISLNRFNADPFQGESS